MQETISVIVPTRKRPQQLRRMYKSIQDTAEVMPEVLLYIDNDDQESSDIATELEITTIGGPRQKLSLCYNEVAEIASGSILKMAADDEVYLTKGWDSIVIEEFEKYEDRLVLVHGDDKFFGESLSTHSYFHREWEKVMGYYFPPYFSSWWLDNWVTEVAKAAGRLIYLPSVVCEHMHTEYGKSETDSTYEEAKPKHDVDAKEFMDRAEQRLDDIEKLKAAICLKSQS